MEIANLIDSIRLQYLDAYRHSIAKYTDKYNPSACEVLIERQSDSNEVFRLYRIDLASGSVDPPNFTEVNPESYVSFERLNFSFDDVDVSMYPIYWNGVDFEITPPIHQAEIQQWAFKWIDINDTADTDEYGLGNYLHSITEPLIANGTQVISIDFGSSEPAAFFELLHLISSCGAKSLCIHSSAITGLETV